MADEAELIKRIVALFRDGKDTVAIAKALGQSEAIVERLLHKGMIEEKRER